MPTPRVTKNNTSTSSFEVLIYLCGEDRAQRKEPPFLICAQWSGVKLCAVRMSDAILRMTLKVQGIRYMHDGHQTNRTPLIQTRDRK